MENKNIEIDPHAEARGWHEKGGQVEFINHANSNHKEWEICDKPEWSSSCVYRPYTQGLEVGMKLQPEFLQIWCNRGNEFNEEGKEFIENNDSWSCERKIAFFDIINKEVVFYERPAHSGEYASEIAIRAAGFLDFMQSFESKKEEVQPAQAIESVPEVKEEMFTQEELKSILSVMHCHLSSNNQLLVKIQSLIQPEPVPPVAGDIYCYNENVGYAAYGVEGWHLNTSAYGSNKIVDVPKQDWHKLIQLKPAK